MMEAGWEPAAAEEAVSVLPAWRAADAGEVATFADANVRMWDEVLERTPGWPIDFRAGIARAWTQHRGKLAGTTRL
jgi:hypothetical protein